MGKAKEIPLQVKQLIVNAVERGKSYSKVAEQFAVSKASVVNIISRHRDSGDRSTKKRSGRPRISDEKEDNILIRLSKQDPRKSAPMLKAELSEKYNINMSVSTTKRRLRHAGLFGRRPIKKPMISRKNRKARVEFAREHINKTPQQWAKVLWSDESKFNMFGSDGIRHVRRPIGEKLNPRYMLPTMKHGGGNVMVWGCFSRDKIGPLHRIEGIMDQVIYKDIIKDVMLPHAKKVMPRGWQFQQDNDPKHTARSVSEFFSSKKIRVLKWPSQSPDLNPIEHLWEHLERQLTSRKPSKKDDLFQMLNEAWNNINPDVLINLVDSMPRRCQAVIKSRGYPAKY